MAYFFRVACQVLSDSTDFAHETEAYRMSSARELNLAPTLINLCEHGFLIPRVGHTGGHNLNVKTDSDKNQDKGAFYVFTVPEATAR